MMSNVILLIIICSMIISSEDKLWDLGVSLDKNNKKIIQQEINLQEIELDKHVSQPNLINVRALHSDNFIPPMIKEFKTPMLENSIMKAYDEIISHLSLKEKIKLLKEIFLTQHFSHFFSVFKSIDKEKNESTISLYIQKLYFSNQYKKTLITLHNIAADKMTDDVLFFKIKTYIKLKKTAEAKEEIETFINIYPNSDYFNYVIFEKKLIELNEK